MVTEESTSVAIAAEVDRAYENVPGTVSVDAGGKTLFKVERSNLADVVVWNPWEGASGMADFGPADGYKNMREFCQARVRDCC
jgi:glucose-6-phosphate 1-epimerase